MSRSALALGQRRPITLDRLIYVENEMARVGWELKAVWVAATGNLHLWRPDAGCLLAALQKLIETHSACAALGGAPQRKHVHVRRVVRD